MAQLIFADDPMETRGLRGEVSKASMDAGGVLIDKHPEIKAVLITIVFSDSDMYPTANALSFCDELPKEERTKSMANAIESVFVTMLMLAKQLRTADPFSMRDKQG